MTRFAVVGCVVGVVCATAVGTEITIGPRTYEVTESRINDFTWDKQYRPSVAVLTNGNFIVGWTSHSQLGCCCECIGKVFSATGQVLTSEVLLNPNQTSGWEFGAVFGALPGGGFAVAYAGSSGYARFQRFDSALNPVGADTIVGTWEVWPLCSSSSSGDFVVAYGRGGGVCEDSVSARRYNSSGIPYGPEFQVNTDPLGFTYDVASLASCASAPDGSLVVAWCNAAGDIRAQLYDPNGAAVGGEFTVNSSTGGSRVRPTVQYTPTDDIVVTWYGSGVGDSDGIYARRLAGDGSFLGDEWLVNETTTGSQTSANLGVASSGEFIISWRSDDGDGLGVFARLYDASGKAVGSEFQVNQFTSGNQYTKDLAGREGIAIVGDMLVFTWYGNTPGDNEGIGMTLFKRKGTALTVTIKKHPEWGEVLVEPNLPYYDPNGPNNVVTLTAGVTEEGKWWGGWSGDVDPNDRYTNPLTITMDTDKDISTSFKCGMGTGPLVPMALGVLGLFAVARRRRTRS